MQGAKRGSQEAEVIRRSRARTVELNEEEQLATAHLGDMELGDTKVLQWVCVRGPPVLCCQLVAPFFGRFLYSQL